MPKNVHVSTHEGSLYEVQTEDVSNIKVIAQQLDETQLRAELKRQGCNDDQIRETLWRLKDARAGVTVIRME